jgi:hypothetical protein
VENSANTESRVVEKSANTESQAMENPVNRENQVMHDSGGGARNKKEEKVLLQGKGQLHGGAQGVLPRHKNADCKRCIKESWLRKRRGRAGLLV